MDVEFVAPLADQGLGDAGQGRQSAVGEALALEKIQPLPVPQGRRPQGAHLAGDLNQFFDLRQEPRIDPGEFVQRVHRVSQAEGFGDKPQSLRAGHAQFMLERDMRVGVLVVEDFVETVGADFQAAQGLVERFLEGPANGHHLADRFHLGGQALVGLREFFEVEARYLGDDVIDARLERSGGTAAGDFVLEFVQGIANRQFGRDLGDGKTGSLGC